MIFAKSKPNEKSSELQHLTDEVIESHLGAVESSQTSESIFDNGTEYLAVFFEEHQSPLAYSDGASN